MKNILILAHLIDFSGPYATSRRVEMFARGMSEEGHHVDIVIPLKLTKGPLIREEKGFKVTSFVNGYENNTYRHRIFARLRAWKWLHGKMRAKELDWVLLYNVGIEGLAYILSAKIFSVKVGSIYGDLRFHPHNPTFSDRIRLSLLETADFIIPKFSDHIFVDTSFLKARINRLVSGKPCDIIPPMHSEDVTYNPQSAENIRNQHNLQDSIILGYFGSFWVINGVKNLLIATKILVEKGQPVKTLIAGRLAKGLDCDDATALIEEMNLQNQVIFLGLLSQEDVFDAMGACDILTLPRLNHIANEAGSPTKLGEYLYLGKAVITAAIGDIPRYVTNEENALLIEPGNLDALVSAVQRLIDDPTLRHKLAKNAPQAAQQAFYYRNAIRPLLKAINEESDSIS